MMTAMLIVSWVPDHRLFAAHQISCEISVVKLGTHRENNTVERSFLFFFSVGRFPFVSCSPFSPSQSLLAFTAPAQVTPTSTVRVCIKKGPSFFETSHWSGSGRPAYANWMLLPHHSVHDTISDTTTSIWKFWFSSIVIWHYPLLKIPSFVSLKVDPTICTTAHRYHLGTSRRLTGHSTGVREPWAYSSCPLYLLVPLPSRRKPPPLDCSLLTIWVCSLFCLSPY